MSITVPDAVRLYREFRAEKDALKAKHAEELRPIEETMAKIEAWLLRELNRAGADHIATGEGTAYKATRASVAIDDWEMAIQHVKDLGLWHVLERRLSKTAVQEYVESTGSPFPGTHINVESYVKVQKR